MLVNIQDLIEFLTSSSVSSPTGAMLERARDGTSGTFSKGINNEEYKIMGRANILSCIDKLRSISVVDFEDAPSLRSLAKKSGCGEGALALSVLMHYHRWGLKSQERGLVEVFRFMQTLLPTLKEPEHDEDQLTQAFRSGKSNVARKKAANVLADANLVVDTWLIIWNNAKSKKRKNKKEEDI